MFEHENNHSEINNSTRSLKIYFGNVMKQWSFITVRLVCLPKPCHTFAIYKYVPGKNFSENADSVSDKYFRVRDVCALRVIYKTVTEDRIPFRQYRTTVPACTVFQGCPNREMCSNQYQLTHIQGHFNLHQLLMLPRVSE